MKVHEFMTREIVVVRADATVAELLEKLRKNRITGAPVVDDQGDLVGVASLSDLAREDVLTQASEHDYFVNASWGVTHVPAVDHGDELVSSVMTKLVLSVEANDDILKAADLLVSFGIHRLIVTEHEKPVGVVSSNDLVRALSDQLRLSRAQISGF